MDFSKKVCKKVREKRENSGRSQMETVNRIAMELNIQPYELLQVDEE